MLSKDRSLETLIGESIIKSSDYEKLLGIKIDSFFIFDDHA